MNSFNTHEETLKVIHKYKDLTVHTFNQSQYPRIHKDSLHPVPEHPESKKDHWYVPRHCCVCTCTGKWLALRHNPNEHCHLLLTDSILCCIGILLAMVMSFMLST